MNTLNVSRAFLLACAVIFNFSLHAQDLPETEANSNVLEEVTVTATRRGDTDIMTTPVSMTKLSGDEVSKFALRDLNDIAVSVPGLSAGTVSAFKSAQFAMRGVSETTITLA